jgi:adenylyltransferase/sulfurtransferase
MAVQTTTFTSEELSRYGRQLTLPEIGERGQQRLKDARVLLIGAGGLGSPAALYLAAAGVGTLGVVDYDRVELSNLHRQVLHATSMAGKPKTESALRTLAEINPNVKVEAFDMQLSSANAREILSLYDVIVDGSDNFATRYLVNDACVMLGKPTAYGSVYRFEGQASLFDARRGPCYRCVFPQPPPPGAVPSCAQAGVLGVLPGIIGLIQATEAIKLIAGIGDSLLGRLLLFDALEMRFRELKIRKDPACPVCGEHPSITELADYENVCGDAPLQKDEMEDFELSVRELKAKLDAGHPVELLDVRRPDELETAKLAYTKWIEMRELRERMHELDRNREIVVYCHSGVRSARATQMLRQAGFTNVKNLTGGIDAWSVEIDPAVPRY